MAGKADDRPREGRKEGSNLNTNGRRKSIQRGEKERERKAGNSRLLSQNGWMSNSSQTGESHNEQVRAIVDYYW